MHEVLKTLQSKSTSKLIEYKQNKLRCRHKKMKSKIKDLFMLERRVETEGVMLILHLFEMEQGSPQCCWNLQRLGNSVQGS